MLCRESSVPLVRRILVLIGWVAVCVLSACQPAKLSELEEDVFGLRCGFSSCHSGAAPARGLDLSAGNSYEAMVGVEAQEPGYTLVVPGDVEGSFLVKVLREDIYSADDDSGEPSVRQMPPGAALSDSEIERVESWIAAGAEDN
ncbi:MAG: hypothetical protein CL928_01370 [Deltaproteobacteria bacterium]|nr:hypothetical protein [Deltaproteobacteria bacterium]